MPRCSLAAQILPTFSATRTGLTHRCYSCFDVGMGLVLSDVPDRYAGRSIADVRVSHARQVKVDTPDTKGSPG